MDDIVARAMQKWPDVPDVFGWLRLDRRGNWRIKAKSGVFERVGNASLIEFIGRNYGSDAGGRWFFQNGPQRVFVTLDYTPWVYRLSDDQASLVAHNAVPSDKIHALLVDEAGGLLVDCGPGIGVVNDRDLAGFVERLSEENPALEGGEALLSLATAAHAMPLRLFGEEVALRMVHSGAVPALFGFVAAPVAAPGQPDC